MAVISSSLSAGGDRPGDGNHEAAAVRLAVFPDYSEHQKSQIAPR